MDEKEVAGYYEQRRGDTSVWAATPTRADVRAGTVVFSIRLAPDELKLLRGRADDERVTLSEFIRRAALREAQQGMGASFLSFPAGAPDIFFVDSADNTVCVIEIKPGEIEPKDDVYGAAWSKRPTGLWSELSQPTRR